MTFNNIDDLLTDIQQEIEAGTINENDNFELYENDELIFNASNITRLFMFILVISDEKIKNAKCNYEIMLDQIRVYLWTED